MKLTAYEVAAFCTAVAHALPHRRVHHHIATMLTDNVRWSKAPGGWAFYTHVDLAARRGRQHRNTSRELIFELQELGFIQVKNFSAGNPSHSHHWKPYRFKIIWGRVALYLREHGLKPMGHVLDLVKDKIRSAAAWWENRKKIKAEREAARRAAEQAREAERRRLAQIEREAAEQRAAESRKLPRSVRLAADIARLQAQGIKPDNGFLLKLQADHKAAIYKETHGAQSAD